MALTSGSKESSSLMSCGRYSPFVFRHWHGFQTRFAERMGTWWQTRFLHYICDNCTKHPTVFTPRFRLGLSRKAGKKHVVNFLAFLWTKLDFCPVLLTQSISIPQPSRLAAHRRPEPDGGWRLCLWGSWEGEGDPMWGEHQLTLINWP